MERPVGPIVSVHPGKQTLGVDVLPEFLSDRLMLVRLMMMLSITCKTNDVNVGQSTPHLRVYQEGGGLSSNANFGWVTIETLYQGLSELATHPLPVVRQSSTDMVVHVGSSGYRFTELVCWQIKSLEGVVHAQIAREPVYDGRVIELYVPGLDLDAREEGAVPFPRLATAIRELLTFGSLFE